MLIVCYSLSVHKVPVMLVQATSGLTIVTYFSDERDVLGVWKREVKNYLLGHCSEHQSSFPEGKSPIREEFRFVITVLICGYSYSVSPLLQFIQQKTFPVWSEEQFQTITINTIAQFDECFSAVLLINIFCKFPSNFKETLLRVNGNIHC